MDDFSDNAPMEPQSGENALTSEQYPAFCEALEVLYIKDNISGRLKFLEHWPAAAAYVFGDALIGFDTHGTQDRAARATLEGEAEDRRLDLLALAQTLEEKSVHQSALQLDYVESVVRRLGHDLSLLLYAPKIVHRFIAPPLNPVDEAVQQNTQSAQHKIEAEAAPVKEAPVLPENPADPMEEIHPISMQEQGVAEPLSVTPVVPFSLKNVFAQVVRQAIHAANAAPSSPKPVVSSDPTRHVERSMPKLRQRAGGPTPIAPEDLPHYKPSQEGDGSVSQKMTFVPAKKDEPPQE